MGVRITDDSTVALYCSTSDFAFGPVFCDDKEHDATERAEAFLRWLKIEPRRLTDAELERKYSEWRAQERAQFAAEEEAEAIF